MSWKKAPYLGPYEIRDCPCGGPGYMRTRNHENVNGKRCMPAFDPYDAFIYRALFTGEFYFEPGLWLEPSAYNHISWEGPTCYANMKGLYDWWRMSYLGESFRSTAAYESGCADYRPQKYGDPDLWYHAFDSHHNFARRFTKHGLVVQEKPIFRMVPSLGLFGIDQKHRRIVNLLPIDEARIAFAKSMGRPMSIFDGAKPADACRSWDPKPMWNYEGNDFDERDWAA